MISLCSTSWKPWGGGPRTCVEWRPHSFGSLAVSFHWPLASQKAQIIAGFEIADFDKILAVPCPCGLAKRAFGDLADFPATVHVTEILETARLHYHRTLTEVYYVFECTADARMKLDQELIPVRVGSCILIRPETRHRALGRMKVLILVLPKFDPTDEWFD